MAVTTNTKAKSTKSTNATKKTKTTSKTKAPATKTKTTSVKKTKKTKKTATAKKTGTTKSKTTTTKRKTAKVKTKNTAGTFLTDAIKQASKVQKKCQAETKVWIKQLNKQDKELSQLTKKINKAKGASRRSLDTRITKLQGKMSDTRSGLLAAENSADKVATFIEWVTQLNAKPTTTAYLQTSAQTSSRPTLVGGKSKSKGSTTPASLEEDYPEEVNDEEMNFLFGEDEDFDEETGR